MLGSAGLTEAASNSILAGTCWPDIARVNRVTAAEKATALLLIFSVSSIQSCFAGITVAQATPSDNASKTALSDNRLYGLSLVCRPRMVLPQQRRDVEAAAADLLWLRAARCSHGALKCGAGHSTRSTLQPALVHTRKLRVAERNRGRDSWGEMGLPRNGVRHAASR